jgi:hypothetical protein
VWGSYIKDGESRITLVYIKGQPLTAAVKVGVKDTGSNGY